MGLDGKPRPSTGSSQSTDDGKPIVEESCGFQFACGGPCGTKRYPLPALQSLATPKVALAMIGLGAVMQGFIVNGHTNAIISTIERRFELSSTESGLIASCYDIASCIVVLFVTYVGGRGHKPQWLGWGVFIMGIASIIFSLPHFTAPTYTFADERNTCGDSAAGSCRISTLKNFRFVFYLAMLLVGVGATPLYTLGITYIDENVKQRMSAFYNGILVACSILGPGIGFLVGAAFLRIYTNPDENVTINESNEHWVGAWWIGALMVGVITLLVAVPILLLPKQIPGTEKYRKKRANEMDARVVVDEEFGKKFRDFPRCVWILLKNPTYLAMAIGGGVDSILINGLATFGAKYMETIFGLDPSDSGTYFGILAILGGAGGQLVGGGLLSRFNVSVTTMLHICYIAPLICVLTACAFLIHCSDLDFAGVNSAYNSSINQIINLTDTCNINCGCNSDVYSPVCGSDRVTYYSSCFAGCSVRVGDAFSNCSCVPGAGNATLGICTETGCGSGGLFILFCVVIFFLMFFTFFNEASTLQVSLRCVAFNQRSFGIGLQWLFVRVIGLIPGPLVLGAIFDSTCTNWSEECGVRGACLSYSSKQLSLDFFLFVAVIKLVDAAIFFFGKMMYRPKKVEDPDSSSNRHLNSLSITPSDKEADEVTRNGSEVMQNGHSVVSKQPVRNGSTKSALPGEIPSPGIVGESGFFDNPTFANNEP